ESARPVGGIPFPGYRRFKLSELNTNNSDSRPAHGLRAPIIDELAIEIDRIAPLPDVQSNILAYRFAPLGDKTEPFVQFVNAQTDRWAEAVKAAGIEPQ